MRRPHRVAEKEETLHRAPCYSPFGILFIYLWKKRLIILDCSVYSLYYYHNHDHLRYHSLPLPLARYHCRQCGRNNDLNYLIATKSFRSVRGSRLPFNTDREQQSLSTPALQILLAPSLSLSWTSLLPLPPRQRKLVQLYFAKFSLPLAVD